MLSGGGIAVKRFRLEEKIMTKPWLFFDVGSTLVDETASYQYFVQQSIKALADCGIVVESAQFYQAMMAFSALNQDPINKTWDFFAQGHGQRPKWSHQGDVLYADAKVVLSALVARYHLGIIANQNTGLQQRLADFGIFEYFTVILTSAELGIKKPQPEIFLQALSLAKVDAVACTYVGDRYDNDIIPAKQCGMTAIRIHQGLAKYNIENQADKSDYHIDSLSDLISLLI